MGNTVNDRNRSRWQRQLDFIRQEMRVCAEELRDIRTRERGIARHREVVERQLHRLALREREIAHLLEVPSQPPLQEGKHDLPGDPGALGYYDERGMTKS